MVVCEHVGDVGVGVRRVITPYRDHAHKRYSSMNRVPDFFRATQNDM